MNCVSPAPSSRAAARASHLVALVRLASERRDVHHEHDPPAEGLERQPLPVHVRGRLRVEPAALPRPASAAPRNGRPERSPGRDGAPGARSKRRHGRCWPLGNTTNSATCDRRPRRGSRPRCRKTGTPPAGAGGPRGGARAPRPPPLPPPGRARGPGAGRCGPGWGRTGMAPRCTSASAAALPREEEKKARVFIFRRLFPATAAAPHRALSLPFSLRAAWPTAASPRAAGAPARSSSGRGGRPRRCRR